MGDWIHKSLGEITGFQGGNQPPKSQFINEPKTGYIRLLQIRDFKSDNKAVYIPNSDKNKVCKANDIMIARYGASVGQIHRGKSGAYNVALIKTIPNDQLIDRDYFYHYLTSDLFQNPLMVVAATKAAQAGFSKEDISGFKVQLPPLPEQQRIVSILDEAFKSIDQAIANTEKNLANARELFESYLNNVFTQKGEGWVSTKLGELTIVQSGGTPLKSTAEYWDGDISWYSSGELNELYTSPAHRNITEVGVDGSNAKLFPKGSLLIGMYDTAALKMSILDRDAAFNQAIAGAKPEAKINLIFIMYAIEAIKPQVLSQRRGVRQKNLNLSKIKDIPISIPTVSEQDAVVTQILEYKKMVHRLDTLNRRKLESLTELKQSILQKAFSGELTTEAIKQQVNG